MSAIGVGIAGLVVIVWLAAILSWRFGRLEERWPGQID